MIVSRDISRFDPRTLVEEGLGIYELWVGGHLVQLVLHLGATLGRLRNCGLSNVAGFQDVLITAVEDDVLLVEAHLGSS